jgi:hypothetical protein
MDVTAAALAWHEAGYCVLPAKTDGSKAPAVVAWKHYQAEGPTRQQIDAWFASGHPGVGLICGAISGGLEMLELEGRAVAEGALDELTTLIEQAGLADLWLRLTVNGYTERTPSGGLHFLYRVDGAAVPGNTKLANRPATEAELATKPGEKVKVLAETRGESGYVVIAPSNGATHPTRRPWTIAYGQPGVVPTITAGEREQLHRLFRCLDRMPRADPPAPRLQIVRGDGVTPGDDFENKTDWTDALLLGGAGWTIVSHHASGYRTWRRPGKDTPGISATTGRDPERDRLYVFSSATVFDTERPYTKFGAYALLHHGGDHSAAARQLRRLGYGAPPTDPTPPGNGKGEEEQADDDAEEPPPPRVWTAEVDVSNPAIAADWLRVEAGRGRLAGLFRRVDTVVHTPREGEDGYLPVGGDNDQDGPAQVRPVNDSTLASRITYTYGVFRFVKRDQDWEAKPALFPRSAARTALDVPDMLPNLRPLRGVVHSPVFRPDGSLVFAPGYDPETGLLHLPEPGLEVPRVPEQPTASDVRDAVKLLLEMIDGFPFVSPHFRANYLGALITPLLRAMAPPPYKLHAIEAHQPGSGKTLLANLARFIHGGVFRAELPEDDAELRKQITSILSVTTGPVVVLDNVSGALKSSTLAGLLTSDQWDDRPLGSTAWTRSVNDRLWTVTGNNLNLGGDLPRRTVRTVIDPGRPNPELRTGFAINDLERWVKERRGELLHALLVVVRAWVAAGRPTAPERASDGYARWVRTVEGILSPRRRRRRLRPPVHPGRGRHRRRRVGAVPHRRPPRLQRADLDREGAARRRRHRQPHRPQADPPRRPAGGTRGEGGPVDTGAASGREVPRTVAAESGRAVGRRLRRPLIGRNPRKGQAVAYPDG